ncbi:serine/threonine-protein kinase 19 isoform X2 [Momordica charantia]|uniref:Serine/threonine-protein kinase 19 isoform X2 n=1 Tax=Momordica charantia TaxID=3673 RepID=A0A6J1DU05_MOMCH|nr:serine/threonine-protein kinase 19 isoform X2 [Momordica charantia]
MSNISESSKARKRRREAEIEVDGEENDSETISLEDCLTFSDTLAALRMMRAQFPHIDKVSVQPFILQSQLYSSLKDRTEVDRELEIDHVISRFEERMQCGIEVFQWFKTHVIDCKLEPSIGHQELCTLLSLGGKVKDEDISLLMNAGLLNRQLIDPNMYWFAIPSIGSVLKGISQGRKELISLLRRSRYKEMMMSSLQKKRLRFSSLDMRFHIRDLIGSGNLRTVQSPTGLLVQLSKH